MTVLRDIRQLGQLLLWDSKLRAPK